MRTRLRLLAPGLALLSGCIEPAAATPPPSATTPSASRERDMTPGLDIELSEGSPVPLELAPPPAVPAMPTSDAETASLLGRLPATPAPATKSFAFRERSLPPETSGALVAETFPPPSSVTPPAAATVGALEVVRVAPDGAVAVAPQCAITFSQPMVAVTSMAALVASEVPVQLTPLPSGGAWRWVGTKTLLFEAGERLPMATEYRLDVPAGTRSAVGGVLAVGRSFSFETPAPRLVRRYPEGGPQRTDSLIFLGFDQLVDPRAVAAQTSLTVQGKKLAAPRPASAGEIADRRELAALVKEAVVGRFAVLTPGEALPAAATIVVTVAAGLGSLEGPKKTTRAARFELSTYAPLAVVRQRCGWSFAECRPQWPFNIEFNNPLDPGRFAPRLVEIEPAVEALQATVAWNQLRLEGRTKARTRYRIKLSKDIRDQFGQTLGKDDLREIEVGAARPQLLAAREGFVVLDPARRGHYSVFSVNHSKLRVRLYKVTAADFYAFAAAMEEGSGAGAPRMPGAQVYDQVVQVAAAPDEMVETSIDLRPALDNGVGQVIAVVEQLDLPPPHDSRKVIRSWIQVTGLGLAAFVDHAEAVAWVTRLADGTPVAGATLTLLQAGATVVSDAGGLGTLPLPVATEPESGAKRRLAKGRRGRVAVKEGRREILVATDGTDVAILPESTSWWESGNGWVRREITPELLWYVIDDRGIYRPNEEVHLKGWLRQRRFDETGDLELPALAGRSLAFKLVDARGNTVQKGERRLNALAGFDLALRLSDRMSLGPATVELTLGGDTDGASTTHRFEVAEFRRPEFEVTVKADAGPHVIGRKASATVAASYYAGGGLPFAEVTWTATSADADFTPPNRGDFTFGSYRPWWVRRESRGGGEAKTFAAQTGADGAHTLGLDFTRVEPRRAKSVALTASVVDVNRQTWSAATTLLVHAALTYVGLQTDRPFVDLHTPIRVKAVVTDVEGNALAARPVAMRALHLAWVNDDGVWKEKEEHPQECAVTSTPAPVACVFQTPDGGRYRIVATVADDAGRTNESELEIWVSGGKLPPKQTLEAEKVTLIPSATDPRPGDTVSILVQSPISPAAGLLTVRKDGVLETRAFELRGPTATVEVPIRDGFVPNVRVQVDVVGSAPVDGDRSADPSRARRPAYATGSLNLRVPPSAQRLTLAATPRARELEPGGETVIDLRVEDAGRRPVANAEVAVLVVDEAVLALTGYELRDPMAIFYPERGAATQDLHSRAHVLLADAAASWSGQGAAADRVRSLGILGSMGGGGSVGDIMTTGAPMKAMAMLGTGKKNGGGETKAVKVRTAFDPLAVFAPEVATDAGGRAEVRVKLPDNLSRYRIMAVAAAGARELGMVESTLTARLPLMVRPAAPRFLSFGDQFELGVVVQNQTERPLEVQVGVRGQNARLLAGAGRRLQVAAKNRGEVRLPAAAMLPGTARFDVVGVAGAFVDAATVELPVYTPATTEAFAAYGEVDAGAVRQPVRAPADVVPDFGGLSVETSATAVAALSDAVISLVAYRFECSEQLASRILGIAALKDVLPAFAGDALPPLFELMAAVGRDVKKLQGMQQDDGGFGLWRRDSDPWPFVTTHVTHALWRARQKGFAVPEALLAGGTRYLDQIESHVATWDWPAERRAVTAYALYVLHLMGQERAARGRAVFNEAGPTGMPLEALGFLLPVLASDRGSVKELSSLKRFLKNRVTETAATAAFVTEVSDRDYLTMRSSRRADAVILAALVETDPKNDLVVKLVRGLFDHRQAGHWQNTQEDVFVLLALERYFARLEAVTPDFVAETWLGDRYAGAVTFKGRTTERHQLEIPMAALGGGSARDLLLVKHGPGRLYYRIGLRYAPKSLGLAAADAGFTVLRSYESTGSPSAVRRGADGVWHIKAGATVRVRLTLVAPARRYHVALVDQLPAGLEPTNPALKVSGRVPIATLAAGDEEDGAIRGRWRGPWYEHQNLRDERVEAFASLLADGVYRYDYVARATTLGSFVVPPAKAEEMYHPETFGRTASDRVVVE
ncbi:MAG: hypothetical protein HY903_19955 [Deltaproteobacteria bacterium]|nr:hypothetical protein [Deltaproteobacteria bacterium]